MVDTLFTLSPTMARALLASTCLPLRWAVVGKVSADNYSME